MRLNKFLSSTGISSRRKAEELITAGKIFINGKKCLLPQTQIDPEKDSVTMGKKRLGEAKKYYIALHKPKGYLCTNLETKKPKRAVDLVDINEKLYTIGRLDKDTTGLILITNDGDFANIVAHPSFCVTKEYLVKVDKEITHAHLVRIQEGTDVEGKHVTPHSVEKVRRGTLKIVVEDGRKHEVRILCLDAGLEVFELKRIRVGHVVLGGLEVGKWRALTEKEIADFAKKRPAKSTQS